MQTCGVEECREIGFMWCDGCMRWNCRKEMWSEVYNKNNNNNNKTDVAIDCGCPAEKVCVHCVKMCSRCSRIECCHCWYSSSSSSSSSLPQHLWCSECSECMISNNI